MQSPSSRSDIQIRRLTHELNSPLSVCTMAASMLPAQMEGIVAALDPDAQASIASMLEEWREANALLQSSLELCVRILGSTRTSVDHAQEARPLIDLQTALQSAINISLARRPDLQVQCRMHFAQPVQVRSDVVAWHQIIGNLVSNSLNHGFAGRNAGTIRITGTVLPDQRVLVHYYDDGVGFTVPAYQRLYEEGFTTRAGQGGNGLGMGIVRDLVRHKMGGHIKVHRPAKGVHIVIETRC